MTDFKWRHFQGDVILWAVRWYCRYPISYRDLEEMLAERGISVDHTTIYRWVQRYAPEMEKRLRWFWRRGFRILRDPYSAKPYVLFYTTKRVGGGIQDFDAIKLLKFGVS